jgi:hypothetical protein
MILLADLSDFEHCFASGLEPKISIQTEESKTKTIGALKTYGPFCPSNFWHLIGR